MLMGKWECLGSKDNTYFSLFHAIQVLLVFCCGFFFSYFIINIVIFVCKFKSHWDILKISLFVAVLAAKCTPGLFLVLTNWVFFSCYYTAGFCLLNSLISTTAVWIVVSKGIRNDCWCLKKLSLLECSCVLKNLSGSACFVTTTAIGSILGDLKQ